MVSGTHCGGWRIADLRESFAVEDTREEPFPLLRAVLQRAAGGTWRPVDMGGHVVYAVPVYPVGGCTDALCLVVAADVYRETGFWYPQPMGYRDAHTRCPAVDNYYGPGLLDLYAEVEGPFLRVDNRYDGRSGAVVGLPRGNGQVWSAGPLHLHHLCCGLSADGHLRIGCCTADGNLVMETVGLSHRSSDS